MRSRLRTWLARRAHAIAKTLGGLQAAGPDRGGHWSLLFDSHPGAWQQHVSADNPTSLTANSAVFACVTLIAGDMAKLPIRIVRRSGGIWSPSTDPGLDTLLRKPNPFQTRAQFVETWLHSRLLHGNTYVLKERGETFIHSVDSTGGRSVRRPVTALRVLDPYRVTPLIAPDGFVFYRLDADAISVIEEQTYVPATEIIHDRVNTLWHPLVGQSPLMACAWSGTLGSKITRSSSKFFENMSRPSGMLTAPGAISQETADRIKATWEKNFSSDNAGKLAVMGDGLKYEAMSQSAEASQLIEQLEWSVVDVARTFRVPLFMINAGETPAGASVALLTQQYYSQCLQAIIESIECALDDGLELDIDTGTEFDLDELLRMDTATRYKSLSDAVNGGWLAPNEARRKEGLQPVAGGDTPYLQQQNYSLAALEKRDAKGDPFAKAAGAR